MSKAGNHRTDFDRQYVQLRKTGSWMARAGRTLSEEFKRNPVEYQRKLRGSK